ncbi:MAG: hypothetical protein GY834_15635 [Bacteroidetes bacterium]|nr:hypothetical protein [Bacteroidota bacterium]
MESFLEKTAKHIFHNYHEHLADLCIVLPNRRASLFLRKHLASLIGKNSWSPQIYSIEDFIQHFSSAQLINNLSTAFELFEVHKIIEGDKTQQFDEFYKWGTTLIQDFNEIDQHLVPADKLYSYLTEIKTLGSWDLEGTPLTEFQNNYLSFFNSLHRYYQLLNERLGEKNLAYNGKMYKYVADNIESIADKVPWEKIFFMGFNALTTAEQKIIFTLRDNKKAELLWDTDDYYVNYSNTGILHEAGLFLREHFKTLSLPSVNWIESNIKNTTKEIQIIGVPKMVGQAKYCGQVLTQSETIKDSNHNSAVILADENLLIPVLNSIPSNYSNLNVTMGLPISTTSLFSFLEKVFQLQLNAEYAQKTSFEKEAGFKLDDFVTLLNHQIVSSLNSILRTEENIDIREILDELKRSNRLFISAKSLYDYLEKHQIENNFFDTLINLWKEPKDAVENIKRILEFLRDLTLIKQNEEKIDLKIEIEIIFQFSLIFNKIQKYIHEYNSIISTKALFSIFIQLCKTQKLPLFGEPLQGLQIMGMLESRNLDFENLMILSVNENILPSSGKQNSFIPFEVKKDFKLPTYKEKNAIYAYHLFRLIQRSKKVFLIYNSEPDVLAGGDKSRFIYQLIEEFPKYNPNIKIVEKTISSEIIIGKAQAINVKKDDQIISRLKLLAIEGFSPSSLNLYIRCPLQFYFRKIAKLGTLNGKDKHIDASTFGNIVHETLKNIYTPFIDTYLSSEALKKAKSNFESSLKQSFIKHFSHGEISHGKNLLIYNVALEVLENFLQYEIEKLFNNNVQGKLNINALEQQFTSNLQIQLPNSMHTVNVKLNGIIDRIQTSPNGVEIIDYKSGVVSPADLRLKDWDDLTKESKHEKSFQLLFYAWLLSNNMDYTGKIDASVLSLKRISNGFMKVVLPEGSEITSTTLQSFESKIQELLIDIFNMNKYFTQTDDLKICEFCDYRAICGK